MKVWFCRFVVLMALALSAGDLSIAQAPTYPSQPSQRGSLPLRNSILQDEHGVLLLDPKIVGGLYATPGADPWQVALIRADKTGPDRRPFCGGSLIAEKWAVTAAHCVDNGTAPNQVDVLGGTTDVGVGGLRVKVVEIIVHPKYVPGATPRNDIALLRLGTALIGPGMDVIPIMPLPLEATALSGNATARVTGWGALGEGGTAVRDLRYVELTVFTNADCNDPVAYNNAVTNDMVCAGFLKEARDSCQGDSGGPLTVLVQGKRYLAGIVSWGEGCARPNRYGVYSRIAHYFAWVTDCEAGRPSCLKPLAADESAAPTLAKLNRTPQFNSEHD